MSEILLTLSILLLCSQSACLWSSLINVVVSALMVVCFLSGNFFSGALAFLYVMVYIGGLLVLLVSVASLSSREQNHNFSKTMFFMVVFFCWPFWLSSKSMSFSESGFSAAFWVFTQPVFVVFIFLVLGSALLAISKLLLHFKGSVREL